MSKQRTRCPFCEQPRLPGERCPQCDARRLDELEKAVQGLTAENRLLKRGYDKLVDEQGKLMTLLQNENIQLTAENERLRGMIEEARKRPSAYPIMVNSNE